MVKRRRNSQAIEFARDQRARANEFARDVWQMLRDRRCCGAKFRREYPIAPYTADSCCVALQLVVEVDGEDHFTDEGRKRDQIRDQHLRELGYEVLRIPGYDVLHDPKAVRQRIVEFIRKTQ